MLPFKRDRGILQEKREREVGEEGGREKEGERRRERVCENK
jgi:hypothetical protein